MARGSRGRPHLQAAPPRATPQNDAPSGVRAVSRRVDASGAALRALARVAVEDRRFAARSSPPATHARGACCRAARAHCGSPAQHGARSGHHDQRAVRAAPAGLGPLPGYAPMSGVKSAPCARCWGAGRPRTRADRLLPAVGVCFLNLGRCAARRKPRKATPEPTRRALGQRTAKPTRACRTAVYVALHALCCALASRRHGRWAYLAAAAPR